jgi:phosphatidylglycerol---prolipoprotein diacylglyceryl transferase
MRYELFHLYGPFSIYSYGVAIAIGLLVMIYMIQRDPRYKVLDIGNKMPELFIVGLLSALFGARLVYILSEGDRLVSFFDLFAVWQGGLSVLGGTLALLIIGPLYGYWIKIPVISVCDFAVIYIPLVQAIARIGCFCAGCCHGIATNQPWGITYTDIQSMAPLYICIHPTQLYSSFLFFMIFICMYFIFRHTSHKPGQLLIIYLLLASAERFIVDFWRDDRIFTIFPSAILSFHQILALGIFITSALIGIIINLRNNKSAEKIL